MRYLLLVNSDLYFTQLALSMPTALIRESNILENHSIAMGCWAKCWDFSFVLKLTLPVEVDSQRVR